MAALLPCPFCGAEAHRSTYMGEDLATHDQVEWVSITCVNCGVPTSSYPHGYDTTAEGDWNRRAGPTQWAYDQACKALTHWRAEAERLARSAGDVPRQMQHD